jgi:SAM-dependent methyltransferase
MPSAARHDEGVTEGSAESAEHGVTPAAAEVWARRRTAFGAEAEAYAAGRPSYPPEAVQWVLPAGAREVLDLAAGTGRLTIRLLEVGLDVVAVEPLDEMRAHVPSPARALAGTAEAIPLDDESVDAVFVGQAFHWFDVPAAIREIHRVLRPGGRLGLFWNLIDDTDPVVDRFAATINADERLSMLRDDQPAPFGPEVGAGMTAPERRLFRHVEPYDADRLTAYTLSRSQTILLPPDERDALVAAVRDVVPAEGFRMPLVTEAWRSERSD